MKGTADELTLARVATVLQEAVAANQQLLGLCDRMVTLLEKKQAKDGFVAPSVAVEETGFSDRRLRQYVETGTFRHGIEYRDVSTQGSSLAQYQYNPAAIERLFATAPEKRAAS